MPAKRSPATEPGFPALGAYRAVQLSLIDGMAYELNPAEVSPCLASDPLLCLGCPRERCRHDGTGG